MTTEPAGLVAEDRALTRRVLELTRTVTALEERVARLEAATGVAAAPLAGASRPTESPTSAEEKNVAAMSAVAVLSALGRLCLVLCGGFLLRALTASGTLPQTGGILVGLAYAALWLVLADRSTATGRTTLGVVHGLAAAGLAFPLLWEATTTFAVLSPSLSAFAVAAFSVAGLAVSGRRHLHALAVCVALPAVATAFGLAVVTRALVPFSAALLVIVLATMWLATRRGWGFTRWPAAAAVTVLVGELAALAARPGGFPEAYQGLSLGPVLTLVLLLPATALAAVAVKALLLSRPVGAFDAAYVAVALAVGLGGAVRILSRTDGHSTWLGVAALVLAAGSYVVSFSHRGSVQMIPPTRLFFSSLGLVLTLAGVAIVTSEGPRVVVWSAAAVAAVAVGVRLEEPSLEVQGAVYLWSAAVAARLPAAASTAMARPQPAGWGGVTVPLLLVTVAGIAAYLVASHGSRAPSPPWSARVHHTAMAVVVVAGTAILTMSALLALLPGDLAGHAGALAACRTGVLAAAALALVAARARWKAAELGWLAYAVLALGGLKLLAEDLRHGSPLTLFVGFALYGGALLVVSRHGRPPPQPRT